MKFLNTNGLVVTVPYRETNSYNNPFFTSSVCGIEGIQHPRYFLEGWYVGGAPREAKKKGNTTHTDKTCCYFSLVISVLVIIAVLLLLVVRCTMVCARVRNK